MAKTAVTTIKNWFKTGLFPTQDQFWNWLDSFWHKDDTLPVASVDGLNDLLNSKATTETTDNLQTQINNINVQGVVTITPDANYEYTIPGGKLLEKVAVIPSGNLDAFGIGTGSGVNDIFPETAITPDGPQSFILDIYSAADKSIWFNGITSETTIKIYLR